MTEPNLSVKQWQRYVTLGDGSKAFIRPVRASDESLATEFLRRVAPSDLRLRFFGTIQASDPAFVQRLIRIDYITAMVFVAIDQAGGAMIGAVRLHVDAAHEAGEYAILVRSDWKGYGLGWELMQLIIAWAKASGLQWIQGQVLRENTTMITMCRELGFEIGTQPGDNSIVAVRLRLADE
jgi:acetyltransferase